MRPRQIRRHSSWSGENTFDHEHSLRWPELAAIRRPKTTSHRAAEIPEQTPAKTSVFSVARCDFFFYPTEKRSGANNTRTWRT